MLQISNTAENTQRVQAKTGNAMITYDLLNMMVINGINFKL